MIEYLRKNNKIPRELRKMAETQKLMAVLIPVWNFSFNLYAAYSANETLLRKDSYGMYYSVNNPIFGDREKRVPSVDECATDGEDNSFLSLFDTKLSAPPITLSASLMNESIKSSILPSVTERPAVKRKLS